MSKQNTPWWNQPPYRLIGHSVCKPLPVGRTVSSGVLVHEFSKRDGKPLGSTRSGVDGPLYVNTGVFDVFTRDQQMTDEFLLDNDITHTFEGVTYRPAKPDERGTLLSSPNLDSWNYAKNSIGVNPAGWAYDETKDGQLLWVALEDQSLAADELTEDEIMQAVKTMAVYAHPDTSDEDLDKFARDEVRALQRARRAVHKALQNS